MIELNVDPLRLGKRTGILVRAKGPNGHGRYDVAELDKASLLRWLQSRGPANEWREDIIGICMGHGRLHPPRGVDDG